MQQGHSDKPSHVTDYLDLKKEFPMSTLWAGRGASLLFLFFLISVGVAWVVSEYYVAYIQDDLWRERAEGVLIGVMALLLAASVIRFIFLQLEARFYDYHVRGGNLYISKGIIIKERGSFPLSRITDIYLRRGVGDLIFGLATLHVSTPTSSSGHFAYIKGLRMHDAMALQTKLEELVKEQDNSLANMSELMGELVSVNEGVHNGNKVVHMNAQNAKVSNTR
ncbi:MAG: PH domain-containing protein [Deltaproteobacteria bacterium]|nr:PH domain-containing protein [Deltaproteobacteria bacterium]